MQKITNIDIQNSKPSIDKIKKTKRTPVYVLLDNIRSLHNVGSIFRTSDASMVEKIYLCGITGQPPRKEISKTALGAEEIVPWEYRDDAIELIKELKKSGIKIIAVELAKDAQIYYKKEYSFPICFILGHEVMGISDEIMEIVDDAIYVPMYGRANSLNVATCYGIIVYDAVRKLNIKNN